MANPHRGSSFDDWLTEEGLRDETEAVATKRVLAHQVAEAMRREGLSKAAMARRMRTSRSSLERLLDPDVHSVTLLTIERAARALGKEVRIQIVNRRRTHTARHTPARSQSRRRAAGA